MNRKVWAILLAAGIISSPVWAMKPVTVVDQGSFMVGGTVITAPGVYKDNEPTDYAGETMHGDAAYVAYQIPKKARHNGIVFLHGYGHPVNHGKQRLTDVTDFKIYFRKRLDSLYC